MNKSHLNVKVMNMRLMIYALCLILGFSFYASTASAANSCEQLFPKEEPKKVDFIQDWGVNLLSPKDPAFRDKAYLKKIAEFAKPSVVGYMFFSSNKELYREYDNEFSAADAWMPQVLRFANTGTDANNMLYQLAEHSYYWRTGKHAKRANLLFFGDPYGGTYGRIAEVGVRYEMNESTRKKFSIPTPTTDTLNPKDPAEIARLEKLEDEAIRFIKSQVAKNSLEIGGIFLEPISTTKGLKFFRPEFLMRLRKIADDLKVPIMADEIFTGGGRTGKFWAFDHYGIDFRPDLFTFGKGMGVSGVAQITRKVEKGERYVDQYPWPSYERSHGEGPYHYPQAVLDNTSRVHPMVLVQGTQVIKRIRQGNLEDKSAEVGAYALKLLKAKAQRLGIPQNEIK